MSAVHLNQALIVQRSGGGQRHYIKGAGRYFREYRAAIDKACRVRSGLEHAAMVNQKIRSEGHRHVACCEDVETGFVIAGAPSDFSRPTERNRAAPAQRKYVLGSVE